MTVNSLTFLAFFGVLALVYYLVRPRFQWMVLLAASIFFAASSGARVLLYLCYTSVTTFFAVRWMGGIDEAFSKSLAENGKAWSPAEKKAQKEQNKKKKRHVLVALLVLNIGALALTKYSGFLLENLNLVLGFVGLGAVPVLRLAAPLGISYYTLQSMGYALDVYKGKVKPEKNFAKTFLFVGFFPQMTQGPIGRFKDLAVQLYDKHPFCYENLAQGCRLLLWGFFKKCVIADRMNPMVSQVFDNYQGYGGMTLFLGCIYMSIQAYADFSAYMDIVSGFSRILGIRLAENFHRPFFSKSLAEYWRRWHITLSSWFRDYLFYPLSISKPAVKFGRFGKAVFGVRIGKLFPAVFALFIMWFSTGLWHDASWRYILWGVANGVVIIGAMILEPQFTWMKKKLHVREESGLWQVFCMVRTFLIVSFLKVFPGPADTAGTLGVIKGILTDFRPEFSYAALFPGIEKGDLLFVLFGLVLFFCVSLVQERKPERATFAGRNVVVRWGCYFVLLAGILCMGAFEISMVGGFAYAQY